ncbi:putative serine/threonine-protein kinase iks1 [Agyrium rufum]|nr:putative serine/threonine-protein kinase iks1 [Agyrium rufum]
MNDEAGGTDRDGPSSSSGRTATFPNPEYFRMLQDYQLDSSTTSRSPSPRRRLTQPSLSGTIEDADHIEEQGEFVSSEPVSASTHGISSKAFSPGYFRNFFKEVRELGKGGNGVVLLVQHVLDGLPVGQFACKRIPVGDNHEWLKKVLHEVQLLQRLSHQNLVSYRHVWLEDVKLSKFGPSVPCAFVLQQFCNGGDLHVYIYGGTKMASSAEAYKERLRRRSKTQVPLPENLRGPKRLLFPEIHAFFKDITAGLNHLHANKFIHRDLKPQNCLLHKIGDQIHVLVSDFGEVQAEDVVRKSTGATGTISFCAPEVLRRDFPSGNYGNFTTKSDIFSLGMILYFLCFGDLPYANADNLDEENEDLDKLRAEITTWGGLEDPKRMRPDLQEGLFKFLQRLLSLDPSQRPSTEEILIAIKTGAGLEDSAEFRPRSAGRLFEEHRTNSRISPIETPPAATPSQRPTSPKRPLLSRPAPPSKLRLGALDLKLASAVDEAVEHDTDSDADGKELSSSLVLHSSHASPIRESNPTRLFPPALPSPVLRHQLFEINSSLYTLRIVVLVVKIVSITLPCIPLATRPPVAFTLLGLAIIDLLPLASASVLVSAGLAAAHAFAMAYLLKTDTFCLPKSSVWDAI